MGSANGFECRFIPLDNYGFATGRMRGSHIAARDRRKSDGEQATDTQPQASHPDSIVPWR